MFPHTPQRTDEPAGWHVHACLPLALAELLLDWLDNHDCPEREVWLLPDGVTVRWRPA